jgi:hypothetical protein
MVQQCILSKNGVTFTNLSCMNPRVIEHTSSSLKGKELPNIASRHGVKKILHGRVPLIDLRGSQRLLVSRRINAHLGEDSRHRET